MATLARIRFRCSPALQSGRISFHLISVAIGNFAYLFDFLFGICNSVQPGDYSQTGLHSGENLNGPLRATLSPICDCYRMIRPQRQPTLTQSQQGAIEKQAYKDGDARGQEHER